VLERGKSLAEKHFECEVAIVCSSLSHGFTGIRAAFEETNAAQRTPSLSMPDMRIAPDMPAPLAYNEERQLFTRTMQSGDALALRARLAEIGNALALEQTWRQDLHFALVVQSCEEAAALARPTAESVRHLLKKMYAAWSAEGLNARMAALAELAESVRASYERASNEGRGEAIAAKADAFIARRYDWQELGVAQVADHLRIGSSYASMLYKKQRGQSILDAINRVRLEHAKARLRDTDDSMADIASRVGYASGATFLRAFKKYEGVTPGQYRAATDINDNKK
jgi:AraC-like DNA-binding protein